MSPAEFSGIIVDTDMDHKGSQIWGVKYQDGDSGDYFADEIYAILESHHRPPPMLGSRVAKYFADTPHFGTTTATETEKITNSPLCVVRYEDGDTEDLNMNELVEARHLCIDLE